MPLPCPESTSDCAETRESHGQNQKKAPENLRLPDEPREPLRGPSMDWARSREPQSAVPHSVSEDDENITELLDCYGINRFYDQSIRINSSQHTPSVTPMYIANCESVYAEMPLLCNLAWFTDHIYNLLRCHLDHAFLWLQCRPPGEGDRQSRARGTLGLHWSGCLVGHTQVHSSSLTTFDVSCSVMRRASRYS